MPIKNVIHSQQVYDPTDESIMAETQWRQETHASSTASSCGRHRASLESRCRTDSTNRGSFGKALFRLPPECIWSQSNTICTKSLEFVKSVYGERSAYDNERADFYLWLCFMRLRRENSSSSKRDTYKYTGCHCKSFVNNGRYHLTLSNECAILLCVLPQKGGSRS